MDVISTIKNGIDEVIKDMYGVEGVVYKIEHPANESFGDYATNVSLVLSKALKQQPLEIAKSVSYKLQTDVGRYINTVEFSSITYVAPGFINLTLSDKWLNKLLSGILSTQDSYKFVQTGDQKRIALEHSNVNPNKAAHVGHLRNACVGQFIERVYEYMGYNVEVQYYANNVGVQVATSNMGVAKMTHLSPAAYSKFDQYAWDVYAAMEAEITAHPELNEERMHILAKLENPTSPEFKAQKQLADKILLEQLKTFSDLDIDYDVVIYESDIVNLKMWERAFEALKNNKNVYLAEAGPSKGCWLVKMEEHSTPDVEGVEKDKIIVRSNGIPTYTGKDIAYHMWKFGLLNLDFGYTAWAAGTQTKPLFTTNSEPQPAATQKITFSGVDYVYDVIGVEQTYAMNVVKQALKYLGYPEQAANMRHVNYGFVYVSRATAEKLGMDVSDGRKFYEMKGRKGWGVKIDDFIAMVDAKLIELYGAFEYIKQVRNSAIKFQMLKSNTFQDLVFDLEEALDTKGYSGPYIQYAFVRANSVVIKSGLDVTKPTATFDTAGYKPLPTELAVLRWIYRFPEIVKKAADEFSPNLLCEFLFELAKRYNSFYNSESILNAATPIEKAYRVMLSYAVSTVLKSGLWLLGIEAPPKM